jgi:hypothetical protein
MPILRLLDPLPKFLPSPFEIRNWPQASRGEAYAGILLELLPADSPTLLLDQINSINTATLNKHKFIVIDTCSRYRWVVLG